MAHIWEDRVLETSTTTGTGNFTLAGAITGYRAFSAVCSTSDTVYYSIVAVDGSGIPTGEWETGLGTYSASNTLTRTTVLESSNAGAAVNFSAGTKRVGISAIARVAGGMTEISRQAPTGTGTVTFSSIPASFTDLVVVVRGRGAKSATFDDLYLRLNGDSGANYDFQSLDSQGTGTPAEVQGIAQTQIGIGWLPAASAPAGVAGYAEVEIFDYAGTTLQKATRHSSSVKLANSSGNVFHKDGSGWWRDASVVTSVSVILPGGDFASGSVVSLYGRR